MRGYNRQLVWNLENVQYTSRREHDWQIRVGAHDHAHQRELMRTARSWRRRSVEVDFVRVLHTREVLEERPETFAKLRVRVCNDGDVTHLAAFPAFSFAVKMRSCAWYGQSKLGKALYLL